MSTQSSGSSTTDAGPGRDRKHEPEASGRAIGDATCPAQRRAGHRAGVDPAFDGQHRHVVAPRLAGEADRASPSHGYFAPIRSPTLRRSSASVTVAGHALVQSRRPSAPYTCGLASALRYQSALGPLPEMRYIVSSITPNQISISCGLPLTTPDGGDVAAVVVGVACQPAHRSATRRGTRRTRRATRR